MIGLLIVATILFWLAATGPLTVDRSGLKDKNRRRALYSLAALLLGAFFISTAGGGRGWKYLAFPAVAGVIFWKHSR
jgi:hypothetical protein